MRRLALAAAAVAALPLLAGCAGPSDTSASDPLCDLHVDYQAAADEIAELTPQMGDLIVDSLGSGDLAGVNRWGATMNALDQRLLNFLVEGRQYVGDKRVLATWDLQTQFMELGSAAFTAAAANATSIEDYRVKSNQVFTNPELDAAMAAEPPASEIVHDYLQVRCGNGSQ